MANILKLDEYIDGIKNGDISILSRSITLSESSLTNHSKLANEIINNIFPLTGNSIRLGITGVPGVGKSSFIESFGKFAHSQNKKVAVLAIDPSSTLSKGSILGDKTRMEELSKLPNVYIRPSPSSGHLGGIAKATYQTILLCEAAGFNYIIIETVGVGQSETMVNNLCDFFLLLMLAGAGDELQGIKRGIMEMADSIVITKADGTNIQKSKQAQLEYKNALHLLPANESGWIPKVLTCSSTENIGIDKVYELIENYKNQSITNGFFMKKRQHQQLLLYKELLNQKIIDSYYAKNCKHLNEIENLLSLNKINLFEALNSNTSL
jgi:LAO/AO transport system kinase